MPRKDLSDRVLSFSVLKMRERDVVSVGAPFLSVVACVYNEEDSIGPLISHVESACRHLEYELVLIDDGSKDGTWKGIQKHKNSKVLAVRSLENRGQTHALELGLRNASGACIAVIDGDLQNDPKDIPIMLDRLLSQQLDVVVGYRRVRRDSFFLKKIPSFVGNKIVRILTGFPYYDLGCAIKVFRREALDNLDLHGDWHRLIGLFFYRSGAKMAEVDVNHFPRSSGRSHYGWGRSFKFLRDLTRLLIAGKK